MKSRAGARTERLFVAALCVVGSLRVGLFAAAFPLGNNIDEPQHLDVVFRYSRADWPRGDRERFDPHVMLVLAGLASFEYLHPPTRRGEDAMPPPYWAQPPESRSRVVERRRAHWLQYANHELLSPPAYYALAALWLRAEEAVGIEPLRASYGVRFLNVPLFALLLWCTWRFCRDAYPGRRGVQLGAPAVLAFLPQDLFYGITSDALSPLLGVLALWCMLVWHGSERPALRVGLACGASVALAMLTKLTNLALPLVLAVVIGSRLRRAPRREAVAVGVALAAATLPVLAWCAYNLALFGDPTAARAKAAMLGWTLQPVSGWVDHPLFSLEGAWTFWSELMRTLWRGGFIWHGKLLSQPAADTFYVATSTVLLGAAAVASVRRRGARAARAGVDPVGHRLTWATVLLSVLVLAALSVPYDYGDCVFPSAEHPYFSAGRLMAVALAPFAVLLVYGADELLRPLPRIPGALVFAALAALVTTASEIDLSRPVFESEYNWFHAPRFPLEEDPTAPG